VSDPQPRPRRKNLPFVIGLVAIALSVVFVVHISSYAPKYKSDMRDVGGEMAPLVHPGDLVIVAQPLTDVDDTVNRLILLEVLATSGVMVVLGAVTWWVVRLGIRPIKRMTETAVAIAEGDRTQRVPEMSIATEAGQLGGALNHMLERLDDAFAQQTASEDRLRRFVADASHELRTPVTTIRGYAELYRVGGLSDGAALDEAMRRTEQEAVRMARLVEDLLNLAKLDQGRPLDRHDVDLAALVSDAARDASAVDPGRPITTTLAAPVVVQGD